MHRGAPALCLTFALCTCAAPTRAAAQTSAPAPAVINAAPDDAVHEISVGDIVEDVIGDFRRLPSMDTARLFGLGSLMSVMAQSADRPLTTWMSGERSLSGPLQPGNIIGGFQFQLGSALATYAVGRLTNHAGVTALGADLLRAHVVSQTVTGAIKITATRTRPDGTHLSFPSGHTSASFASATVLQRHFGWKVGVPAMAVATYVAAARVQEKRHYLSDVAFGAAIGIAAGRTVTIGHGRTRFAVTPAVVPGGAGVAMTWTGQ